VTTTVAPTTTTITPPPPTTTQPQTTTTPPPTPGAWPGPDNTGVPAAVNLTPYTGPTTIQTAGLVIDGKLVTSDLVIQAPNVVIRNSRINAHIDVDGANRSLTLEDSEVHAGGWRGPAVGFGDLTIRRTEITGGQHAVLCDDNCAVADSWLHNQGVFPGSHNNAYISNGGTGHTLRHNTLDCTPRDDGQGGGCTADGSFFGDFATIRDVVVDNNLFVATPSGGYCGSFGWNPGKPFGDNPTNVDVTNNVFQRGPNGKCGVHAAATSFKASDPASTWINNKWDDGAVVPAP
jgi:hypothetical protein